jgi:peptidoglycan/xylan/chitin deacetylase (PgdA/CDA1 family)
MYHDVVPPGRELDSGFDLPGALRYKLTTAQFEAHLDAIGTGTGGQDVLLTFDDGGSSALTEVADRLERRGRRGWFFVTTARIGTPGFLDLRALRELDSRGHGIGSHSHSHPVRISSLPQDRIREEWSTSVDHLAQALGRRVTVASVPAGYFSEGVANAAAAAGISVLFTSQPTRRVSAVHGVEVRGRYGIQRTTPASHVAALVRGGWVAGAREAAWWELKKVLKLAGGAGWDGLRWRLLRGA